VLTGSGRAVGRETKKKPRLVKSRLLQSVPVRLVLHLNALIDELAILHHLQVIEAFG
jgi:hypothetical protein